MRHIQGFNSPSAKVLTDEETVFYEGCTDIVIFGIDLHDFADSQKSASRNAQKMLKPFGRIVHLDRTYEPMEFGLMQEKNLITQSQAMIEPEGFRVLSAQDAGLYHDHIIAGI